ncbi:MAG TPA: hypothetical protein EYP04_05230, partial [Anaerolineae bacterium]|nr:hypothetical protein [Anaerolineae bacterium]
RTTLQYLRARYYDLGTGRFTRFDPFFGNLTDPLSLHKYLYVQVDPINGSDPSGRMSLSSTLAVTTTIGAVAGASYGYYRGVKETGRLLSMRSLGYGVIGLISGGAVGAATGFVAYYVVSLLASSSSAAISGSFITDLVVVTHSSPLPVVLAGVLTGLIIGRSAPESAFQSLLSAIAAEGTAGLLFRINTLIRQHAKSLPDWLYKVYLFKIGKDWHSRPVTSYSAIRTAALWGGWFAAGFAVGFTIGAGTRVLTDAAIDRIAGDLRADVEPFEPNA